MLDISKTEQPDSIEELFAKEFDKFKNSPMDKDTSELFITLTLAKNIPIDIPEDEKPFLYKLMERRLEVLHNYKLDFKTLLFLSFLCKNAGTCVMYIWFLQYEANKRNIDSIDFQTFTEIFAWGFPSENQLEKLWDSQKVNRKGLGSDNLLDYPQAGKSLFQNN